MKSKPVFYVWVKENGECPINFLPEYLQHGESTLYTTSKDKIQKDFNSWITDYCNVTYQIIGKDKPCLDNNNNIILVPCVNFLTLLHIISSIPQSLYNFCKNNNIKICLNYIRESVSNEQRKKIKEYINKYFLKKGYDIKYIKIIINAYELVTHDEYDIYAYTNMFDKFLFNCIEKEKNSTKKQYPFYKKRNYKFSALIGQLHERHHRVNFLYECKKNNLINKNFFYSIICIDKENTHKYIQKILPYNDYIKIKDLIYHKVYNNDGYELKHNEHIYNDGYEYGIPDQILNSYINVVLETSTDASSVTEKIYKPIISGLPFLWLGYKNITKHLLSQGYKLYPFIDYTFDTGNTVEERTTLLIKEMLRLQDIDLERCIADNRYISLHNINNFMSQHYTMTDIHHQITYE